MLHRRWFPERIDGKLVVLKRHTRDNLPEFLRWYQDPEVARLTRYQGWKSASYKGEGVFMVDYQLSGKLGHDYVFPILPEGNIILPFVTVRKREGGKIFVHAPAFSANGFMGTAARMKGANPFGGPKSATNGRTKGSFTITTNGEVLTNNTEDGPVPDKAGRKISWKVGPGVEKIPEALIQLNP